ncbi:hypothetical protein GCM10009819_36970 [Agromyces tropicus]|uniref:histidine kinase n=1 Tax=Agromyces tropicus TaxID=555371 RepID=A0ABP5GH54_9MICO
MAPERERPERTAASRVAVALVAAAAVSAGILVLAAVPAAWRARTTICDGGDCPPGAIDTAAANRLSALGTGVDGHAAIGLALSLLMAGACLAVATLLLRGALSSAAPRGAITAAAALTAIAVGFPQSVPALVAEHPGLGWLGILVDTSILLVVWWIASFPDGVVRGWWARALVVVAIAWVLLTTLASGTEAGGVVVAVGTVIVAALVLATVTAQLLAGDRDRRRLVAGTYATIGASFAVLGLAAGVQGAGLAPVGGPTDLVLQVVLVAAFLAVPVSVAAAVLRRGLWGAAAPVARVVAAAVTALVAVAAFAGGAAALRAAGAEPAVALALPAALLAVVLPALDGLVLRASRRVLTGSDADRRRMLADLGSGLALAASPSLAPDLVASTIAEALGMRSAAIEFGGSAPRHAGVAVPLVHAGRIEGTLVLEQRGGADLLDPAQSAALEPVRAHLAAVLHGRRLARELEASRRAQLAAREDERRRVRDDLHDELGPTLAAATLILGAAEREAAQDAAEAVRLVADAREQVTQAVDDVRRIVRGLRPPALDDVGLVGAIRAYAEAVTGPVRVEVDADDPPALPAAVESAAYAIALEAVANAVRHSGGSRCTVSLDRDGDRLLLVVADDGHGRRDEAPGLGLASMERRARELGGRLEVVDGPGGTTVEARLPLVDAPAAEAS